MPSITVTLVAPAQEQQTPVVVVQSPTPAASAEKTYVVLPPAERREKPEAVSEARPEAKSIQAEPVKPRQSEVKIEAEPEVQKHAPVEEKASQVEAKPDASPVQKPAQKKLKPEEKATDSASRKVKNYNGLGRKHSAAEIDEILDWWILYHELPDYVSDRQRYSYRHHIKLAERRQLLEQAGHIKNGSSRTKKRR